MAGDPFDARLEGEKLYGRGSYDMKGGAAAAMGGAAAAMGGAAAAMGGAAAAMGGAAALADERLTGRQLVALVADEEFESVGASDFVNRHRADACILTEPSELRLVLAHTGFAWFDLEPRGRVRPAISGLTTGRRFRTWGPPACNPCGPVLIQ